MGNSYKKLRDLVDETEFELKTLNRWIQENKEFHTAQLMQQKLKRLFKLYEIE